jgi:hypothetical protein
VRPPVVVEPTRHALQLIRRCAHLVALTGDDVVTLLEQPCRKGWIDVGPKTPEVVALGQAGLHLVEPKREA